MVTYALFVLQDTPSFERYFASNKFCDIVKHIQKELLNTSRKILIEFSNVCIYTYKYKEIEIQNEL